MPHRFELIPMPASREPVSLLAVDRAISDLRRGRPVVVHGAGGVAILALAAEAVTGDLLDEMANLSGQQPAFAMTARRAAVLGLVDAADAEVQGSVVTATAAEAFTVETVLALADPLASHLASPLASPSASPSAQADGTSDTAPTAGLTAQPAAVYSCDSAAVGLTKLARLLPACMVVPLTGDDAEDLAAWSARHDMLRVDAGDVFQYEKTAARTLRPVSEARVPLSAHHDTRIIAFRPLDGGLEHLAIIIGDPDPKQPLLIRLHSECFTGDLLGSLRCDCGDQLQGAMAAIGEAGSGILLYLAQEGRGIGLVNKLRAYGLQDDGFDTLDANEQLGFDADERVYLPAARMLEQLGYAAVRLMTNNPDKVAALEACGVTVAERVPHTFPANEHNEMYLKTKAGRGGHLF